MIIKSTEDNLEVCEVAVKIQNKYIIVTNGLRNNFSNKVGHSTRGDNVIMKYLHFRQRLTTITVFNCAQKANEQTSRYRQVLFISIKSIRTDKSGMFVLEESEYNIIKAVSYTHLDVYKRQC